MGFRYVRTALLVCASLCSACASRPADSVNATSGLAAMAMPDAFSAQVATRILEAGGNAVDAAVAAGFSLAVTYPEAGNIGGGGFMLIWIDGEGQFLDYRETAPAAAKRDMYLGPDGEVVEGLSLTGHRSVGVPGTVAGLWEAHRRFGRLDWKTVVQPAVDLAEAGFVVPGKLTDNLRDEQARIGGVAGFHKYFSDLGLGTTFKQPELAETLRRIRDAGRDGFYRGETAALIAAEMRRGGGLVTLEDLDCYRPVWREPLRATWRGHDVLTAPPPSSGGIALIQLLKMKDRLADAFAGEEHNSPQYIHLTAEMEKRVFADRAEYLGDPDFIQVPAETLISDRYVAGRAASVDRQNISALPAVPPGLESHNTTHFSIVDRSGNAVANSYTLNATFGSGVVVDGGGFLMNDEMDDFSIKPGTPNYYGVVGSVANEVQPRKRMLSSMAPTILVKEGRVSAVLGTEGGSTIITSVYQTLVNVLEFGMPASAAVGATRFHHQLLPPDLVTYSPGRPLPRATVDALVSKGYRAEPHGWEFGDVQLIVRDGDSWQAASDPRGRGESRVLH